MRADRYHTLMFERSTITGLPNVLTMTLMAAFPSAAWAQVSSSTNAGVAADAGTSGLTEIIVTAQRRSESVQSVPAAISALNSEQLTNIGFRDASDVATAMPSVQIQDVFGKFQPIFSLRGISQSSYTANQSSPVGVYADEAYIAETYLHGQNFFDVERVEVLEGPQGTLYGKNTTGGAVNLISRTPTIDDGVHANLTAGYGNYNAVTVDAGAEGTLIPGKLAARLAGYYNDDDGYERVVNLGRRAYQNHSWGLRQTLKFQPIDTLTSILRYTHGETNQAPALAHNLGALPVGPGGTGVDFGGYSRQGLGYWDVQSRVSDQYVRIRYDLVTWTNTLNLRSSDLVSVTSYHSSRKRLQEDIPASLAGVDETQYNNDTRNFSQDLRIVTKNNETLKLIGGLYYDDERNAQENTFWTYYTPMTGLQDSLELELPVPVAQYVTGFLQQFGNLVINQTLLHRSSAAYGQAQWQFAPRFQLTAGLRYTQDTDTQSYYNISRYASMGGPPLGSYIPGNITAGTANPVDSAYNATYTQYLDGPFTTASAPEESITNRRVTGKLTLDYKLTDRALVYATYSNGYRSGNFDAGGHYLFELPDQGAYAEPETIHAYELGLKSELFDRKVRLNTAAFWYDYYNQQFEDVEGIATVLVNAGKSRLRGLEAELLVAPVRGLTLSLNGQYLDAKYLQLTLQGKNLSGNTLISAPTWSGTVAADYSVPVGDRMSASVHLEANTRSRQWYNAFNGQYGNENIGQAGYTLFDGRAALQVGDGYELALWVKNMFDKRYTSYAINIQSAWGMDYLLPGPPRTFGGTVTYRF
jgi:iron complex outermembrane recepter protein